MKHLLMLLLSLTLIDAGSPNRDSYTIQPKQLTSIDHHNNAWHQPALTVVFKTAYWETFFEYTLSHLHKKGTITLGDITFHPYIAEPLFHRIELGGASTKGILKTINAIRSKIHTENTPIPSDAKITFLEKMLRKHENSAPVTYLLVRAYHTLDTLDASKKCTALHKQMEQERMRVLPVYGEIFDCYTDQSRTAEALGLLTTIEPFVSDEERYIIYEKRAFSYAADMKIREAKSNYRKAIEVFKNTDPIKDMNLSKDDRKHYMTIRTAELLRLERRLEDLDKTK